MGISQPSSKQIPITHTLELFGSGELERLLLCTSRCVKTAASFIRFPQIGQADIPSTVNQNEHSINKFFHIDNYLGPVLRHCDL